MFGTSAARTFVVILFVVASRCAIGALVSRLVSVDRHAAKNSIDARTLSETLRATAVAYTAVTTVTSDSTAVTRIRDNEEFEERETFLHPVYDFGDSTIRLLSVAANTDSEGRIVVREIARIDREPSKLYRFRDVRIAESALRSLTPRAATSLCVVAIEPSELRARVDDALAVETIRANVNVRRVRVETPNRARYVDRRGGELAIDVPKGF